MPHRIEQLRATIDELETELASIDELDDDTRGMLEEASREIQSALHPDDIESQSLVERLDAAGQEFGTTHPALAAIIGRVVNALGQLGI